MVSFAMSSPNPHLRSKDDIHVVGPREKQASSSWPADIRAMLDLCRGGNWAVLAIIDVKTSHRDLCIICCRAGKIPHLGPVSRENQPITSELYGAEQNIVGANWNDETDDMDYLRNIRQFMIKRRQHTETKSRLGTALLAIIWAVPRAVKSETCIHESSPRQN
jgi:hypothetical protein